MAERSSGAVGAILVRVHLLHEARASAGITGSSPSGLRGGGIADRVVAIALRILAVDSGEPFGMQLAGRIKDDVMVEDESERLFQRAN